MHILLADDDKEDLELIEEALQTLKPEASIVKVNNGKSAIAHLANLNSSKLPCLIILDYNMPELNGVQTLKKICSEERLSRIPVVILSTSNNPVYIAECKKHGAIEYFVKPNSMEKLLEIGNQMLKFCV